MIFYKAVLKELPTDKVMEDVYPIIHKEMTLEERIGDGKCPDCGDDKWIMLPEESVAVREGGKQFIECMCCGYQTHL